MASIVHPGCSLSWTSVTVKTRLTRSIAHTWAHLPPFPVTLYARYAGEFMSSYKAPSNEGAPMNAFCQEYDHPDRLHDPLRQFYKAHPARLEEARRHAGLLLQLDVYNRV